MHWPLSDMSRVSLTWSLVREQQKRDMTSHTESIHEQRPWLYRYIFSIFSRFSHGSLIVGMWAWFLAQGHFLRASKPHSVVRWTVLVDIRKCFCLFVADTAMKAQKRSCVGSTRCVKSDLERSKEKTKLEPDPLNSFFVSCVHLTIFVLFRWRCVVRS